MPRDVGCDPLVTVCSCWAIGVTALPLLLLPIGKCLHFFSLLEKFLLRGLGLKHGCILVCVHVADGRELSVSKKVEAVGHSVTPCRRNTPRQEKTFSIRSLFAFNKLILRSYFLSFRSNLSKNHVSLSLRPTITLFKPSTTVNEEPRVLKQHHTYQCDCIA